jgi:hypothetical protein
MGYELLTSSGAIRVRLETIMMVSVRLENIPLTSAKAPCVPLLHGDHEIH